MQRLHARYPFLSAAREAVECADVGLGELVAREGSPVVERGAERVRAAIEGGTTGEPHPQARVELLSYPVARVLVSLVDEAALTDTYARAEAATAHERFRSDVEGDGVESVGGERLTLDRLLAEFDLDGDVRETPDGYRMGVGAYLRLSGDLDGESWRLVGRPLSDGEVPVTDEELLTLLREAVRARVAEGLPLSVPEGIAGELADEVAAVREALADLDASADVDAVVPGLFPPCMQALLDRARGGEDLPAHSRFALVGFLAETGADAEEVAELAGLDAAAVGEQFERIAGDGGVEYAPPSCETMQAYDDCVNKDDLCAEIGHPLSYYERRLDDAEEYDDWRETRGGTPSQ